MKLVRSVVAVTAVLAMFGCASLRSGSAVEGEDIEQKIREAKTPADHEAIAAFYEKEAQAASQQQAKHVRLRDAYAARPTQPTKTQIMIWSMSKDASVAHCDALAQRDQEIAKEYEALAAMHKSMAEEAK